MRGLLHRLYDPPKIDFYTQIHLHRGQRSGCFFALISIFTVFGRFFLHIGPTLTLYDGAILFSDDY